jgi:hypothetical protein
MDSTTPRTSTATTGQTEPDVLAGIESGEGQPREYGFIVGDEPNYRGLWVLGAAAALGLIASFGISHRWRR